MWVYSARFNAVFDEWPSRSNRSTIPVVRHNTQRSIETSAASRIESQTPSAESIERHQITFKQVRYPVAAICVMDRSKMSDEASLRIQNDSIGQRLT